MAPGPERTAIPAGEGILRWQEILPAAEAAGARWWIIEQDDPTDPIAEALRAVQNMEALSRES
jgi:sugar phosphate isomerase/epimerase